MSNWERRIGHIPKICGMPGRMLSQPPFPDAGLGESPGQKVSLTSLVVVSRRA